MQPAGALKTAAIESRVETFTSGTNLKDNSSEYVCFYVVVLTLSSRLVSSEGVCDRFEMFACHASVLFGRILLNLAVEYSGGREG
jgi:hypothetical protein